MRFSLFLASNGRVQRQTNHLTVRFALRLQHDCAINVHLRSEKPRVDNQPHALSRAGQRPFEDRKFNKRRPRSALCGCEVGLESMLV